MKRHFNAAVVAFAVLAVAACGGDDADDAATAPSTASSEAASSEAASSSESSSTATGSSTSGDSSSTPGDTGPAPAPSGDPIVIGALIQQTGPNAANNSPAAAGAIAWAGWVNANGGILGRPVELVLRDTARDPAKATAELKDMVENEGVVAIGAYLDPASENALAEYVDQAQIAVLGPSPSTPVWTTDLNYFPIGTQLLPFAQQALADIAKADGAESFGAVVCAESPSCGASDPINAEAAKNAGLRYGGTLTASSSQPSYTAICLQLKSDEVDFVDLALGKATADRLIADCQAQGYEPRYHLGYSALNNELIQNDSLDLASIQPVLPWFADHPAAAEFRAAYEQYSGQPVDTLEITSIFSWTALEVTRHAIELAGEPVSKESVYDGLYALDDTFTAGGLLAQPLSFEPGQPAPPVECYFVAGARDGEATMPQGVDPICPG